MISKLLIISGCLTGVLLLQANAQEYVLKGRIVNAASEPLAYASVSIKELQTGTITDSKGDYKFQLESGKYDILVTMVGYKRQVLTVTITNDYTLNIIMEEDKSKMLGEVQVVATKKDHAGEIVKNVIRHKEAILENAKTYTCNIYIKATDENNIGGSNKKNKPDTISAQQKALAAMNMAEVYLKVDHAFPDKLKEERTAVKIRGNSESLFYLTTTDGDFNFYKNLVQLPGLSAMPMLSPVSNSGLFAYRYKHSARAKKKTGRSIPSR